MDKEQVIERLLALASSSSNRSKAAQLEDVIDGVETAMAKGVPRAEIVKCLSESGLEMSLLYFDTLLKRIRKKRKATLQTQRSPDRERPIANPNQETQPVPDQTPKYDGLNQDTGEEPDNIQTIFDPSDLRALLNKKVDLAALSQLGKELNRKRKKDENSRN